MTDEVQLDLPFEHPDEQALLQQLEKLLQHYDWYWMMSDDHSVFCRGQDKASDLDVLVSRCGSRGEALYRKFKKENQLW
jgi:hypothetical protein